MTRARAVAKRNDGVITAAGGPLTDDEPADQLRAMQLQILDSIK